MLRPRVKPVFGVVSRVAIVSHRQGGGRFGVEMHTSQLKIWRIAPGGPVPFPGDKAPVPRNPTFAAANNRSRPHARGRDLRALRAFRHSPSRNGAANLFMIFAPLEGWRRVEVTDRHTAVDYAQVLKDLSDVQFPAAEKIVLVQDNLSTHTPALLYAAFPAPEARRLVNRFEWHYTPKHGSWLDMARVRTRRSDHQAPEPPHPRQADPRERSRGLGKPSKQTPRQSRLAIHDRKRPGQIEKAVPPV